MWALVSSSLDGTRAKIEVDPNLVQSKIFVENIDAEPSDLL